MRIISSFWLGKVNGWKIEADSDPLGTIALIGERQFSLV
jgi:hypothetical protein